MCGRYTIHTPRDKIRERYGIARDLATLEKLFERYNVAPSQPVAAVRIARDGVRELVPLRWGLIPHWAKDPKTGYSMINARAETVAAKPAFRDAFRRRRCLIPADGFYEWKQVGTAKQPFHIRMKEGGDFAFAGLWEHWQGEDQEIESCSIIVTDANDLLRPIHDRMPVILDPADYEAWLDPENRDTEALAGLLMPYPAERMEAVPVSRRVNSPKTDEASLLDPVETT
jgi:putative SOS response-associated peptidase YedK